MMTFSASHRGVCVVAHPQRAVRIQASRLTVEARTKVVGMGCMGTKAGMTTYFLPTGEAVPCTVVALEDGNMVTQVKTQETDGYEAVQIGYQPMREKNIKKPELGHLKKSGVPAMRHLAEYRIAGALPEVQPGQQLDFTTLFKEGDIVDVAGTSSGKGFQGGIKRWNMHRGFMTHGSKSHRGPGTIGMRYSGDGGRVMPGIKMPGHLGNERVTVKALTILKVDPELRAIVIKGSVPGKAGGILSITPAKLVGKNFKV